MSYRAVGGGFMVDWRDEFNVRHRKLLTTEEGAKALDAQLRETTALARKALRNATRGALSLPAALDVYTAQLTGAAQTKRKLRFKLAGFLRRIGTENLADLTPQLLASYLAVRAQELSPTSLHREAQDLKRWFEWLAHPDQCYLVANPLAEFKSPEPPPPPRHCLTYEEEAKVLAALTPRLQLRVIEVLDTGLARQEITALRKNHINLEEATLTTWRQKTRRTRTIPLTARLTALLAAATKGLMPDSRLTQWGGKEVKKGTDFLKKLWPRVGFHFRFHDLRHTFATRIAAATTNPFVVSELLGHSPAHVIYYRGAAVPRVTRTYVQPQLEELRAAVTAMEAANPNCSPARPGPLSEASAQERE